MNAEDTTQNTPEDDGPQAPTGDGAERRPPADNALS